MIRFKKIALYDYDTSYKHKSKYGQMFPPDVDLNRITGDVPIAIFAGKRDEISNIMDQQWLK